MKLGILATGTTPDELLSQYGSYASMVKQLFAEAGYTFSYEVFDVRDDMFPTDTGTFDGWVITGSKFNTCENRPWMVRLRQLIVEISTTGKPMIGICFGHQIIAEALGGSVGINSAGWGTGLHQYQVVNHADLIPAATHAFTLCAMHHYQVTEKPERATVLASSDFCPNAALLYDCNMLSFQAHPEFTVGYERELIELREGEPIPVDAANAGLASMDESGARTEATEVVHWMASFLQRHQ